MNAPSIEILESRIAPAITIVDAHTATYAGIDLDHVKLRTTVGNLNALGVFISHTSGGVGTPIVDQLQELDLSGGGFDGTDVTFTVAKQPRGDGLVNVSNIDSTGYDLGTVTIPDDLGQIDAGDHNADSALTALHVRSMGLFGKATQPSPGSLTSDIAGPLGTRRSPAMCSAASSSWWTRPTTRMARSQRRRSAARASAVEAAAPGASWAPARWVP